MTPLGTVLAAIWAIAVAQAEPEAHRLAREALYLTDREAYVSARDVAERALALDPQQHVAHYVLGLVMHEAEGNLPRAMYHLGKARELYETRYAGRLDVDWRFHQELLYEIHIVAGELEAYGYQLQILDYFNTRSSWEANAERAWPLMKLGRIEEARSVVEEVLDGDPTVGQRSIALNTLCAIEAEVGDREAAYAACLEALRDEEAMTLPDITVDAFNAALSARAVLRFDEAEALARKADTGVAESTANPFTVLAEMALARGQGEEAVAAVRSMQGWRGRMPPYLRDQNRAELDATFALVLLGVGEAEFGYGVISRAIDFPDRRAMTTGTGAQARGGHALIRLALGRLRAERADERAATRGFVERLGHAVGRLVPDPVAWRDRATVTAVMTDPRLLDRTFRPYLDGGLPVPPWLVGDLIGILGPGVVDVALQRAREAETLEGIAPYHDAYAAEIAWVRGDEAGCRALARAAVEGLPREEALLRARVLALAADAAWRSGAYREASSGYEEAFRLDPGVFRRLGLALPASVEVVGDTGVGALAGRMLRRSPRFFRADGAFTVRVEGRGERTRICLASPSGSDLVCEEAPVPAALASDEAPPTDEERAAAAVDGFHRVAFALATGMSPADLRSLDGTATLEARVARERMRDLLDELTAPSEP